MGCCSPDHPSIESKLDLAWISSTIGFEGAMMSHSTVVIRYCCLERIVSVMIPRVFATLWLVRASRPSSPTAIYWSATATARSSLCVIVARTWELSSLRLTRKLTVKANWLSVAKMGSMVLTTVTWKLQWIAFQIIDSEKRESRSFSCEWKWCWSYTSHLKLLIASTLSFGEILIFSFLTLKLTVRVLIIPLFN